MLNGKTVNVDFIIEKVGDLIPPGESVNRAKVVELIWEAMSKVASQGHRETRTQYLLVENYKTQLPGYLDSLLAVSYVTNDTSLFTTPDELGDNIRYHMSIALEDFFQDDNNNYPSSLSKGYRYIVKGNYIHTTFKEGIIELAYSIFPIDEQGEPLIPFEVNHIDAVVWYIIQYYLWRMFVRNTAYREQWIIAKGEFEDALGKARVTGLLPNEDYRIALQNEFLRILPLDLWRNPSYRANTFPQSTTDPVGSFLGT